MGEWRYSFTILGLGTRWRLAFSFTPGERAPVPIGLEAWRAPDAVWTLWSREKYFCSCRESNRSRRPRISSLYRLSYPGSHIGLIETKMKSPPPQYCLVQSCNTKFNGSPFRGVGDGTPLTCAFNLYTAGRRKA
jgi:hypothetical protein